MRITHVLTFSVALLIGLPSVVLAQRGYDDRYLGIRYFDDKKSGAYEEGLRHGLWDARHSRASQPAEEWRRGKDRRDYEKGYKRGYQAGLSERNRGWYRDPGRNGRNGDDERDRGYRPEAYRSDTEYGGLLATARQVGYQDGLNDGAKDRRTGHSFRPTEGDNYKDADRGYNSRYLSKDQYKQYYRMGYEEGYRRGYHGG